MKFTCNRDALIEGINIVQKAIPGKSTLPVLEGILIEVGEELILTGSDNDISITYEVPSIIEEIGGVVVSSKTFGEIIRKLPDIYLTIETAEEGRSLIIDSGNAHFEITYMEKSGYPKVDPLDTTDSLSISQNNLKTLIRQTAFSASQDNTRPILKGVLVENKSGLLNFVALDGFRLAIKNIDSSYDKDFSMIVSARVLNELSKIIDPSDEFIYICSDNTQIMFYNEKFKMISRLLQGDFIDYTRMIPKEKKTVIKLNRKEFLAAVERVAIVLDDDRKKPIVIKNYDDEIVINVAGERGVSREVLSAEISGEEMELFFSSRHILECLRAVDEETINLDLTSPLHPVVIKSDDDDSFTFLVMPVRQPGTR